MLAVGSDAPRMSSDVSNSKDEEVGTEPQDQQHQEPAADKKSCFSGLEMAPELVWDDWDLGREFTKTLVLKNIYSKLQKLHLRPPVSKFFTTLIPKIIVLSPGTSFLVPVTFKPLQRCEYEDRIEFQGKDGIFQVCLRAAIPCHALEMPASVLLPVCAVEHHSHTTFRLKNTSKLHTCFQWVTASPFQLSPDQGLLKPNQECLMTVVFRPQEALVYQQLADCRFGEEDNKESRCTVLLQGLAKYPCLQLRNTGTTEGKGKGSPMLHFGSVAVGQSLQKRFDIFNPSPVMASFSLSQLCGGVPLFGSEFCCDVTGGKVAPGQSQQVTVTYSPAAVDTVSVEYLSIKCRGTLNKTLLKLTGTSIGPRVSLSSPVVDFGCVVEGGVVTQTVKLINSSSAVAVYQWDLDCNGLGVFSIQPASGTVCPHGHSTLKAVFRPTQPLAHHRRVACLILHREPLFLHLIGTCHSELHQPAILRPEHLISYKRHWYCRQDPPEASSKQEVHLDPQRESSTLEESNQRLDNAALAPSPMEEFYQSYMVLKDPLSPSSLSYPHITVVPNELVFNHTMSSSSASYHFVSITNHTRGRRSVVWTVAQDSPFTVSPTSCDLAPLKSTSFRVTYEPKKFDTLHGAQLECFTFNKDTHHTTDQLLCLPWCVTVRVIGHSFQPGKEHFIPRCSLKPAKVVFPALSALSYRTVLLQNGGDLPLTFCVDQKSNPAMAESVSIIPNCGFIQPGRHQILSLRTIPSQDSPKEGFSLQLQLNAAKHTKELTVVNVAEKPHVSLEEGNCLYFQPTAVGSQTHRSKHIRNLSRLSLRFQWSIPESEQGIIFVEPDVGELHPNESAMQTWSFSPVEEKTHSVTATLTFWPIQTNGCDRSQLTLEVEGLGCGGFIEAEEAVVDVGETLVGGYRSIEIPLVNHSPCSVSFSLSVHERLVEDNPIYHPETKPSALDLDCESRTLASKCKMLLRCTVRPRRRAQYIWTISYQTVNSSGCVSSLSRAVCEVRAQGSFPTLQAVDMCGSGNMGILSKDHLWKLFSLDSLNRHLLSNPCSPELTSKTPTRNSLRSSPSIFTRAILDFSFSANPVNSDPSTFVLMFRNPGSFPVHWAFLFPDEQKIELEYWAQTGELSGAELGQMSIQDKCLFHISPHSGTLQPGQQRAVQFSYSNTFVGTYRFPVVFKLSYGRKILLNLQGVTVERDRPYLHYASNRHVFASVPVRDSNPPRQMFQLHNAGALPVHYQVDTSVLSQLQVDNFNHPVLRCLNPEGEILPGKVASLEWIFSPLQPQMYHMDIPIHIHDGESTLMTFEGCGIDSPSLTSSNQFNCSDSQSSVQRVSFPGQAVFLSEDSISLGDIPVSSQCSRILFLTNTSHTDTFHFTWELPQQNNQRVVQIHPDGGSLCPGQSVLCVLTFTPANYPTVYRLDVICQVFQEAAIVRYHDALQCWHEERKRQQDEFTITDQSEKEIHRTPTHKEFVASPVTKAPTLRKYKTLPPICLYNDSVASDLCNRPTEPERVAPKGRVKHTWSQPEPPQPSLLHLGVAAHSHGLLEYITHFPEQFNKLYRCLLSDATQHCNRAARLPRPTQGPDKDVAMHILMSLLKNIIDDSAFTQSVITVVSKPITYQPTEAPPSRYPSAPSSPDLTTCPTSSHPPLEPQIVSNGTKIVGSGLNENDNKVDGDESAGALDNKPRRPNMLLSERAPAYMAEEVLLNTLQNLMIEAVSGELVLTAHPRSIILPPISVRRMSRAATEQETENLKRDKDTAGI